MMRLALLGVLVSWAASGTPALIAVVNRSENTVSLIDPSGKVETAKLATGAGPHEVAACGNRVLVSNYGAQSPGSTISVYDAAARKQVATIDVAPLMRPHGLVCAGEFAYFTAESNLAIGRIRVADAKFDLIIGHGQKTGHMIVRAADVLYVANISSGTVGRIVKASGPGGFDVTTAKAGASPEGLDVSPDGKQVWAANRGDSTISVIDTASMTAVDTLPTGKFVFRLRFRPDGKRVVATVPESDEVLVFDAATHKVAGRVAIAGTPLSVAVAADGRTGYVVAGTPGRVVEIDLDSLKITREFPTGAGPDSVALVD
jgi:YVTN family beta-propeller protein